MLEDLGLGPPGEEHVCLDCWAAGGGGGVALGPAQPSSSYIEGTEHKSIGLQEVKVEGVLVFDSEWANLQLEMCNSNLVHPPWNHLARCFQTSFWPRALLLCLACLLIRLWV